MKEKIFKYIQILLLFVLFSFLSLNFSDFGFASSQKPTSKKGESSKKSVKKATVKSKVKRTSQGVKKKSNAKASYHLEEREAQPISQTKVGFHKVKKGETPAKIAKLYGTTPEALLALNEINPRALKPGMMLKVPLNGETEPQKETQTPQMVRVTEEKKVSTEKRLYHKVKKGETLFSIAKRYGKSVEELKRLNHLKGKALKVGTTLLVGIEREKPLKVELPSPGEAPSLGYQYHTVQEGETLYRISLKYGVSVESLREINHLQNDILMVGQKLKIPSQGETLERPFVLEKPKGIEKSREETLSEKFEKNVLPKNKTLTPSMLSKEEEKALMQKFLDLSLNYADRRYKLGGEGDTYLDCSAFVKLVYEELGIKLPRSSVAQFQIGDYVDKEELIPGDLVFFKTRGNRISHVGIYLGDKRFIHISSSRKRVSIDSLEDPYYKKRYAGAKRVLNGEVLEYFQDYLQKNQEKVKREPEKVDKREEPIPEVNL